MKSKPLSYDTSALHYVLGLRAVFLLKLSAAFGGDRACNKTIIPFPDIAGVSTQRDEKSFA